MATVPKNEPKRLAS